MEERLVLASLIEQLGDAFRVQLSLHDRERVSISLEQRESKDYNLKASTIDPELIRTPGVQLFGFSDAAFAVQVLFKPFVEARVVALFIWRARRRD